MPLNEFGQTRVARTCGRRCFAHGTSDVVRVIDRCETSDEDEPE
jgi:hypothetical protein